MPIECPIKLPRLSHDEMKSLDYEVMKHAFASHTDLGRLCDETIYQSDLAARLEVAGLGPVRRETRITVSYRDFIKIYDLDLIVADRVIYELKTAAALVPDHKAQLLNYLLLTNSTRGKLINFRPVSVQSEFVNTDLTYEKRRRFEVDRRRWCGDDGLISLICDLLNDWGLFLEVSLYVQALTHFLGGEAKVVQQVPMSRSGIALGNQRFHLLSADTAFRVTAYTADLRHQERSLCRMLGLSPLKAMHWINMNHQHVSFVTLQRDGQEDLRERKI
jgi:GxxExxY protein